MAEHFNQLGQPIGFPLPNWTARPRPPRSAMEGRYCRVEPVDPARDAADLYAAYRLDKEGRNWTYLPHGPYARFEEYLQYLERAAASDDPFIHCIIERQIGRAVGVASYMRIDTAAGVIEVGGINYSPLLQRTPAATEAMYLMMRRVFDELGYRRYEWKCDALNAPSRAAALRSASATRDCSGRPRSTRAATATPAGSRSSTANGQPSKRPSSAGSIPAISTPQAASGKSCRASTRVDVRY
jgi:RimJ/RimL family protein N-acetyltransferase